MTLLGAPSTDICIGQDAADRHVRHYANLGGNRAQRYTSTPQFDNFLDHRLLLGDFD